MIIVTGGAGFIGSCIVSKLNRLGRRDILVTDDLGTSEKWKNLRKLRYLDYLDKSQLFSFLEGRSAVDAVVHMGACSATTERDAAYLMENNYRYTLKLARYALDRGIRFIYASSAATYGDGSLGYEDKEDSLGQLSPLNMYGYSKHVFDLKAQSENWFRSMAGLKFFNVYGPNEYHKDAMASVIFKAVPQIRENGSVKLFKSHRQGIGHGGQLRDFVYVKDVVDVVAFLIENPSVNGLFNLGTGKARSFKDLASAVFKALNLPVSINYIDMPESIRDRYQYFTEAPMDKLQGAGFSSPMTDLETGVMDYVTRYLATDEPRYY